MQHKKQAFDQIGRTHIWNFSRGNTSNALSWALELSMLREELDELAASEHDVDRFDALLDLMFVIHGSLAKMGLTPRDVVDGYEAVLVANEAKPSSKDVAGKVKKPDGFVGPEPLLQTILDNRK